MRTSRNSIGVLTLIIIFGVSQQATPAEKTIVPLAEPNVNAGTDVLPSPDQPGALLVPSGCRTIGGTFGGPSTLRDLYRGNRILITDPSQLTRLQMDLQFFGLARLHFLVHEQCVDGEPFVKVAESIVDQQGNDPGDVFLRTYSSEVFVPPVQLFAGCTYAVGVAWLESISFENDERQYPTENDGFPDGDVLGATHINHGPPIDDLVSFPSDESAYLMHLCLSPKPGACCLGPGVCQNLTQADCEAAFGTFTAERFLCDDLLNDPDQQFCPLVLGGCCLPHGGGCFDLDRFACENESNAGIWNTELCLPDGSPCAPSGACCREGAISCSDETESGCADIGGEYQGDNTNCTENGLACSVGACCVDDICAVVTDAVCAGIPGIWRGSGSACDATTCDPPGACCFGTFCEDEREGMNAARCDAAGGVYQGDFSDCGSLRVSCGKGACCLTSLGCFSDILQSTCDLQPGGVFSGIGTSCETLDAQCPGTCCLGNSCQTDWTPDFCSQFGGVFHGYGVDCPLAQTDPDPCDVNAPPSGKCCLADGSCVVTTQDGCTDLDGGFDALSPTCSDGVPCVDTTITGACCLPDGRCAEISEAECTAAGGGFDAAAACTVELCALGICCHDDRSCDPLTDVGVTIAACTTGSFFAGRTTCDVCPKTGPCCLPAGHPAGPCDERTRGSCEGVGGQFEREERVCPADPTALCALSACCQDDGTCRDTIACNCLPANYHPGVLCDALVPACPAAEACCLPDRSCEVLTRAACTNFGGDSNGLGTNCDNNDTCTEGACCVEGQCADDLTIDACALLKGIHQGVASVCTPGETCTEGACCVDGEACQDDLTIGECTTDELGGTHQGIGTDCTDVNLCSEGACCVDSGVCEELTVDACIAVSGTHKGPGTKCEPGGLCTEGTCCQNGIRFCFKTEARCLGDGGIHLGAGSVCDGSVCLQGACCVNDGTCRDGIVFDQCRSDVGIFEFEGTCDSLTCAPAGACCDVNSNCSQLTRTACAMQNGTFFGENLLCDGGSCPGACCFAGGNCLAATVDSCDNGSGLFDPDKTCQDLDYVCGGSCCRLDGTCQFVSETDCDVSGGDLFSPDESCEQTACEARGACCTGSGCSEPVTESACTSGGGLYLGDASTCDARSCDQGGCCQTDGTCEDGVFRAQCSGVHEVFDISSCGIFGCDPRGACCLPNGICEVLTAGECAAGEGEFGILGTNCDDLSACTPAPCCLAENRQCGELPRIVCERDGGVYRDDLAACDLACDITGTSCVDDNGCRTCEGDSSASCTTDADCPVGVRCILEQRCSSQVCTRGACCDADGHCADDQYKNDCTGFADGFFINNVCNALSPSECAPKRACCKTDGTCEITTNTACVAGGGLFSDLRECRDDLCDFGACCDSAGGCREDLTGRDCMISGGSFQGAGMSCGADGLCHSCCTGDEGSCVNAIETVCTTELGGTFAATTDCSSSPCAGACCDNGQCAVVDTHAACPGGYQGNGTVCDPGLCDLGACCRPDGVCSDRVIRSACDDSGGVFRPGVDCDLLTCDARGACCNGVSCTLGDQASCAGVYAGDGTFCETATCEIGSCCAGAGGCTDSVIASQCTASGDVFRPGVDCASLSCVPPCGMADLTGIVFADANPIEPNVFDQPGNCAIDAREPHAIGDPTVRNGWDRMVMSFSCDPATIGLTSADFTVSGVPAGVVPGVSDILIDSVANTATVLLDDSITPQQWTCIAHAGSGGQWCMGYLPADAGQDGLTAAGDITDLINSINSAPGLILPLYASDINRSGGLANGQDILRLIDLLNGADTFDPWITRGLPPCPAP